MRIEQVLLNFIRNAIHDTEEGGIILVSVEPGPGSHVRLIVRDTGVGIESEHLSHVFDRIYRIEESRARTSGGAVLGLAFAKEMVEAMGGSISVDSVSGEGTTFTITLNTIAPNLLNVHSVHEARREVNPIRIKLSLLVFDEACRDLRWDRTQASIGQR